MGALFGAGPELPYAERAQRLVQNGIALWDVCAAAQRPGSLDASIVHASVEPNDFGACLAAHPEIGLIGFNGGKAAELYRHLTLPGLPTALSAILCESLPPDQPGACGDAVREKAGALGGAAGCGSGPARFLQDTR